MDGAEDGEMTGKAETAAISEVSKGLSPLAALEDSQFTIWKVLLAILTV